MLPRGPVIFRNIARCRVSPGFDVISRQAAFLPKMAKSGGRAKRHGSLNCPVILTKFATDTGASSGQYICDFERNPTMLPMPFFS